MTPYLLAATIGLLCPPIPNFSKVDAHVYRGAAPETGCQLQTLHSLGVASVIDLRPGNHSGERIAAEVLGMRYVQLPRSGWRAPSMAQMREELAALRSSDGPVFVHCQRGADRTGTLIGVWRVESGWKPKDATAEMRFQHNFWGYWNMRRFVRTWKRK